MPDRRQPSRAVDSPVPCFIRLRTERHGPWLAARIYRALGMLCAEINGASADVYRVWASGDQISEKEYRVLLATANSPKPF